MVGRFGMSDEIGFVAVLPQDGEQAYPWMSQASERTRQRIDDEVKRIVGEAHDDAIRLLSENRNRLDSLAEALVRAETLDQRQALQPPASRRRPTTQPAKRWRRPYQTRRRRRLEEGGSECTVRGSELAARREKLFANPTRDGRFPCRPR